MPDPIIKPIALDTVVRVVGVDLDTLVTIAEGDCCTAISDRSYFCDLPLGHDGPHEARVPALVTLARWAAEHQNGDQR